MKINPLFTCFFLALLLLFTGCADENQTNETPQGLGRAIFDALRDDDKTAFAEHIYTDVDRDELLKVIKDDERLTDEVKSETQQMLLNFVQVNRPELEGSFAKLRQQALECGLQDWSDADFVTSTFDQREAQNLKWADVKAMFRWNGLEYELDLNRCLQTERGWVLLSAPDLRCKR